jgi:hypothetical protein
MMYQSKGRDFGIAINGNGGCHITQKPVRVTVLPAEFRIPPDGSVLGSCCSVAVHPRWVKHQIEGDPSMGLW